MPSSSPEGDGTTIHRVDPRPAGFVQVMNDTVRDARLSFKATGLLVWLLSQKDDYAIDAEAIAAKKRDGRRAVLSALQELEEAGYLERERVQGDRGRWTWRQVVHEVPPVDKASSASDASNSTEVRSPNVGPPKFGNRTSSTEYPPKNTTEASFRHVGGRGVPRTASTVLAALTRDTATDTDVEDPTTEELAS